MDLGQEVERSLKRKGILGAASAAWICQVADRASGGLYAAKTFKDGTLTVSPRIPAAKLQMESPRLIAAINKKLGRDLITRIRIRAS